MMPVGDVQRRNAREGGGERVAIGAGDAPERVLNAIRRT